MIHLSLVAFVALMGFLLAVQPLLNARVGGTLGHPVYGALLSVALSTLTLALLALVMRLPWPQVRGLPHLPSWTLIGGVIGAFVVLSALLATPRLGAATTVALFIAGQLTAAIAIDHFGWLGVPRHAIDLPRALGVACLVAGVALVRWV